MTLRHLSADQFEQMNQRVADEKYRQTQVHRTAAAQVASGPEEREGDRQEHDAKIANEV